jgi:tetratricopeptide (TPR) repeat protein
MMLGRSWMAAALMGLLSLGAFGWPERAAAQDPGGLADLRRKAAALLKDEQFASALPLLERIVAADPNSGEANLNLGMALATLADMHPQPERAAMRLRARTLFLKARELGLESTAVDALVQSIPPDGSDRVVLSPNAEADSLMAKGMEAFAARRMDEAQASYQEALRLDPQLYEAALYIGDVFLYRSDYATAEAWYQKAIAIDPSRETAYRYSATPLMWQGRTDEARDRYVEAYISEPYNRSSVTGLERWARETSSTLKHPEIVVPATVTVDANGDLRVDVDQASLSADDGSKAWVGYGGTRVLWYKERFARTFPMELMYRRSLQEETEALRSVLSAAAATADNRLSPSLSALKKLDAENLLEPYILLARANEEIARDYPAYLEQHRDRLRQYVFTYLVRAGAAR